MVSKKPKILLIGPPGAGKTVIANKISELFSIPFVKVGALLRDLSADNENYSLIKSAMEKGELAPNNLVALVVKDEVSKMSSGFVLDGWLRQLADMQEFDPEVDYVLFLNCPKEICAERILNRMICKIDNSIYGFSDTVCNLCGGELERRSDDTPETFENRWKIFEEKTMPVLDFFKQKGNLVTIDASKSIPEITEEIKFKIKND